MTNVVVVLVAVAVLETSGGTGSATPASMARGGVVTATGDPTVTQLQGAGQSASLLHVLTLGWHVPGNDVELVHVGGVPTPASVVGMASGGGTGLPAPPPTPDEEPPEAAPVPAPEERVVAVPLPTEPDDPEQVVLVVG